jgi:hypothetical protein
MEENGPCVCRPRAFVHRHVVRLGEKFPCHGSLVTDLLRHAECAVGSRAGAWASCYGDERFFARGRRRAGPVNGCPTAGPR